MRFDQVVAKYFSAAISTSLILSMSPPIYRVHSPAVVTLWLGPRQLLRGSAFADRGIAQQVDKHVLVSCYFTGAVVTPVTTASF